MPSTYFVLVNTKICKEKIVKDHIEKYGSKTKDVNVDISEVFGAYDMIVTVSSIYKNDLDNFVSRYIRKAKGVQETLTIASV